MNVMEEKLAVQRAREAQSWQPMPRRRNLLPLVLCSALALFYCFASKPSVVSSLRFMAADTHTQTKEFSAQEQDVMAQIPLEESSLARAKSAAMPKEKTNAGPVDLEAHIMSQCPDAQDCLQKMVIPAMEEVAALVNFTLSFIGKVDEDGDSVECKHGPVECLGNMLMLCADDLYPDVPIISLGFANCLISDYQRLSEREFVHNCALAHAVDFDALNACASDDARGGALLRKSVTWSKQEGVTYSCTVRVNGNEWCVRDDGQWKDCVQDSAPETLVDKIRTLAKNA